MSARVWDGRKSAMEVAESQRLAEPRAPIVEDEEPYTDEEIAERCDD